MASNYYITTTLPYVNADPHLGFALEIIQADAIARYQRLQGKEVIFNTGTDEHGLKIYRRAEELRQDPKAYCDEYAARFHALKKALNLSYTHFIRTTDPAHTRAAQAFWKRCEAHGDIYKKSYRIKYCVGCELEKMDSELKDDRCPIHPQLDLELLDEENYFFRFSRFQDRLLKLYRDRPDFVLPKHRLKEVVRFTEHGLEDFSISRLKSKMPWGVPVPNDPKHVMYVWFDALVNYISTLGWPKDEDHFKAFWPGVQIAGKDNLRQQSNMWQGMMMSAGLPPSKQILIHGFITAEGQKMSKSVGNVINPIEAAATFGIDPLRFYLLREIPTEEDGDFNRQRFQIVYNSDLANRLGNLLSRVLTMTEKYYEGSVPPLAKPARILRRYASAWKAIDVFFESFDLRSALEVVIELLDESNVYVEQHKPWVLDKEDKRKKLGEVLYVLLEGLRQVSWMLEPFIPQTAAAMRKQLGMSELPVYSLKLRQWGRLMPGGRVKKGAILFPRLG